MVLFRRIGGTLCQITFLYSFPFSICVMKEIFNPQTLKTVKEFSSIKIGEYIPSTGKRIITQFDILPNAVFYREDTLTPATKNATKNFKQITKMGHVTPKKMCEVVNKVLSSSNSRIKGIFGYTGGVTLHGQKVVSPNGKTLFGDLPEIPDKMRKLLKL